VPARSLELLGQLGDRGASAVSAQDLDLGGLRRAREQQRCEEDFHAVMLTEERSSFPRNGIHVLQ
jgi:hypothetical protein